MPDHGANYDAKCEHNEQRKCDDGETRDGVCSSLGLWIDLGFNMCRVKATVVSGTRGVVDACPRNSNSAGYTATPEREMRAAHSHRYAGSGLGEIERQTWEKVDAPIEPKITQVASNTL
jgi:hypothetical protein